MGAPISPARLTPIARAVGCGLFLMAGGCSSTTGPTPPPTTDPPTISCPAGKMASSFDGNPVAVTYTDPTFTGGQPPFTLACTPVSGAAYPVGVTTVTCTVTDAARRAASCTFPVTVVAPPPPRLSVTTFVAFGDSITLGEDGRNAIFSQSQRDKVRPLIVFPPPQTYPGALEVKLISRYRTQSPSVTPAGVRGEAVTNPGTLTRFDGAIAGGRYAVVLVMEGANDLPDATLATSVIVDGLRRMILHARAANVRPYLATIPPEFDGCCPQDRGGAHARVPGFNDLVRGLAFEQAVPLVDVYAALNTDVTTYIGPDGLHPTAEGYAKIADTFFTVIRLTLETPQPGGSIGLGGRPPLTGVFAPPPAGGRGSRAGARGRP